MAKFYCYAFWMGSAAAFLLFVVAAADTACEQTSLSSAVAAYEKLGAVYYHLQPGEYGTLEVVRPHNAGSTSIPAFQFTRGPDAGLFGLPEVPVPFALSLRYASVTTRLTPPGNQAAGP
jgi:hypothetical protein